MRVLLVLAADIGDGAVIAEAGQGVDMTIGIIAHQLAVFQPQNAFQPELALEQCFQLVATVLGIALGGEQAFGGGQQRTSAVHLDAAALQDQRLGLHRESVEGPHFVQSDAESVVQVRRIFVAPAVELIVQQQALAIAHYGYRAVVAHPGVVGGDRIETDAGHVGSALLQQFFYMLQVCVIETADDKLLMPGDGATDGDKYRFDPIKDGQPVAFGMGPG